MNTALHKRVHRAKKYFQKKSKALRPYSVVAGVFVASFVLAAGTVAIVEFSTAPQDREHSELGIATLSPRGEAGGFAIPASCDSAGNCVENHPTCVISFSPSTVAPGQSSTLTWYLSDNGGGGSSLTINNGIGHVGSGINVSGTRTVNPSVTTTYTGTASSVIGNGSCSGTLTVQQQPAPTCQLWANPASITQGQSFMLGWETWNEYSWFVIDSNHDGRINSNPSVSPNHMTLTPSQTTTYTGTIGGPGGQTTCTQTVTVNPVPPPTAPSCSLSFSPNVVQQGTEPFTYTWSTTNATSFSTNYEGPKTLNGSRYGVSNGSGTYTFVGTATGPGGTANCQASITVNPVVSNAPSCTTSMTPSTITAGDQWLYTWSTNNATSYVTNWYANGSGVPYATYSEDPNGGSRYHTNNTSVSGTYTVVGTATGPNGSGQCQATITINPYTPPPPTPSVNLDIRKIDTGSWGNSATVAIGEDVELQWSSSNATRCIGDSYFSTGNATSGIQQSVSEPGSGQRTYTVRCYNGSSNSDPSAADTVTVDVLADPEITASPSLVDYGETSTVSWNRNGHTGCSISATNGDTIGDNPLTTDSSAATGAIYGETTYTISCSSTGGSDEVKVRIRTEVEEI